MKVGDKVICIDDIPNKPIPIGKKFGITKYKKYKIENIYYKDNQEWCDISEKLSEKLTKYGSYKSYHFLTISEWRKQKLLKLKKA